MRARALLGSLKSLEEGERQQWLTYLRHLYLLTLSGLLARL